MVTSQRWVLLAVFMMAMTMPVSVSSQVPTMPGVEIDCEEKQPSLNVHPLDGEPVEITCTVTNPSSWDEEISVEKEWDGVEVEMTLSEDTFSVSAGDEEDFTVTFTGPKRLSSSVTYDFTLTAVVTNVGFIPDWPEAFGTNASVSGDLNVATFGMVDLDITDRSTRTLEQGGEVKISFQFQNNGNDDDKIRVSIVNVAELEEAGFTFPDGTFVSETVSEDGTSTMRELTIRAPSSIEEDLRLQALFQAESDNDPDAGLSEVSISLQLEASASSTGLGGGLEEVSKDDLVLYGSIAGGVIFMLVIAVALARTLRRRANNQPSYIPPMDMEDDEAEEEEDEFYFEDLDDLFGDDDNDLDEAFADL